MSARFYSPGFGAFTQLDSFAGSAQNPLSMNRFLYALANPATMIDPTGHCPVYQDGVSAVGQKFLVTPKVQAWRSHKKVLSGTRNTIPNDEFDYRRKRDPPVDEGVLDRGFQEVQERRYRHLRPGRAAGPDPRQA